MYIYSAKFALSILWQVCAMLPPVPGHAARLPPPGERGEVLDDPGGQPVRVPLPPDTGTGKAGQDHCHGNHEMDSYN